MSNEYDVKPDNVTKGYMKGAVTINGKEEPFESDYVYRDEMQGSLRFFAHMTDGLPARSVISVRLKDKDAKSGRYEFNHPTVQYFSYRPLRGGGEDGLNATKGHLELTRTDDPEPVIAGTLEFWTKDNTRTFMIKVEFELTGVNR